MSNPGHFNDKGNEYIVTNCDIKRPLLNYFWNEKMVVGVNNYGSGVGGYHHQTSYFMGERGKPRAQLISGGSRYLYIKDESTGNIWNPGWFPSKAVLDDYSCTHGIGFTRICGEKDGIRVTHTLTVSIDEPAELWKVRIENKSKDNKSVSVCPFIEFALDGFETRVGAISFLKSKYLQNDNMIYVDNPHYERPHDWYNGFCAVDCDVLDFTTSKSGFLGEGSIARPGSFVNGNLGNSFSCYEATVGALRSTFEIAPGAEAVFHFAAGLSTSEDDARRIVKKVLEKGYFDRSFDAMTEKQKKFVEHTSFNSPDKAFNRLANYWLKQQVQFCSVAGRGAGAGFRDQLQDAWALASFSPQMSRDKIYEALEHIYHTGRCVRGWLPLKDWEMCDGPGWVAPTINAYIKETGDVAFLDEKVNYFDQGEDTVWEHILTTTRYSSDDTGVHGLLLAHYGDWLDGLDRMGHGGKGESVFASSELYNALLNVAEMARVLKNDLVVEKEMLERAKRLKAAINAHGWDGEWYITGYNDKGDAVGSHTEEEGFIYLNTQMWAAMVGVAEGERLEKCLAAVQKYLDTDYGYRIQYPPYKKFNPNIGRLSAAAEGMWGNSSSYCHGSAFAAVSQLTLGMGDLGYKTLRKITPDSEWNPSSHSGVEPYVYTNMYIIPNLPRRGEAPRGWITGTAGWVYRAMVHYMLGFHSGYDGFVIDPCIPSTWKTLTGTRSFRGDTYNIEITNPDGKTKGVKKLFVDGNEVVKNRISCFGDGKTHYIRVEM